QPERTWSSTSRCSRRCSSCRTTATTTSSSRRPPPPPRRPSPPSRGAGRRAAPATASSSASASAPRAAGWPRSRTPPRRSACGSAPSRRPTPPPAPTTRPPASSAAPRRAPTSPRASPRTARSPSASGASSTTRSSRRPGCPPRPPRSPAPPPRPPLPPHTPQAIATATVIAWMALVGAKQGGGAPDAGEVYRPDLAAPVAGAEELESWMFESSFGQFPALDGFAAVDACTLPAASPEETSVAPAAGMVEFERMKVERRISASLYAMNGLQEYFDRVFEASAGDPLWDLSPLCQ
uniref:Uncharacterized protein n=1 Tax=Aegilops tauschii subsp. strangulata TaxID=200361 RepID=A0A453B804_AEGTS